MSWGFVFARQLITNAISMLDDAAAKADEAGDRTRVDWYMKAADDLRAQIQNAAVAPEVSAS